MLFVIIMVNYSVFITLSWFIKELMNIFEPDQIWKSALEPGPPASVRHWCIELLSCLWHINHRGCPGNGVYTYVHSTKCGIGIIQGERSVQVLSNSMKEI